MTDVTLWHNPRCSKSRGALQLLRERGIDPAIRDYRQDPPTVEELRAALAQLGIPARDLLRTGEEAYSALGLGDPQRSGDALLAAMAAHPELIQRPILFAGGNAVIGRPPERVLELLD